jgi:NAD(P)-dependent dehydrogenase (short-subunit alcohol dehydrogenase family)
MIISITGHTSGLGLAIANYYSDHTVKGFSRSNGYDISTDICDITVSSQISDVFINNAYHDMAQVKILFSMYERWKDDSSKTILNISSNSGDGIKTFPHPYAIYKNALDKTVEQLQNCKDTKCRILNLRPGYIDTPRVANIQHEKLSPEYVAEVAAWMIYQTNGVIKTLTITK